MEAGDLNDVCVQSTRPKSVERLDRLHEYFIRHFEQQPSFYVKVPGRFVYLVQEWDWN